MLREVESYFLDIAIGPYPADLNISLCCDLMFVIAFTSLDSVNLFHVLSDLEHIKHTST